MRFLTLLATIYAATVGTSSALVDARQRTTMCVEANGYDERASYPGCLDGCVPENTLDRSLSSRWSCKGDLLDSSDEDDGCCITYCFEEPQHIVEVQIALFKGNTRTLKVYVNGSYHSTITSSGSTNGIQTVHLDTDDTEELKLCLDDDDDVWISITEVKILVK